MQQEIKTWQDSASVYGHDRITRGVAETGAEVMHEIEQEANVNSDSNITE